MAKVDRLKEEIGWLKVVFGVLVAIDASLIGWIAQNYPTASPAVICVAATAAILVVVAIARINHFAYRRLKQLEDA